MLFALVDPSEKRLLDDIEKLMKCKLDIKPLPEGGAAPSRASSSGPNEAPAKMSDPFFYMLYEPGASTVSTTDAAIPEKKKVGITPAKPAAGVLLGGVKKK